MIGFAREGAEAYWVYRHDGNGRVTLGRKFTDKDVFVEERKFGEQPEPVDLPIEPTTVYLLYVDDKQTARTRGLAEVRDEIEKELLLQERARLQRKWLDRLRGKSYWRAYN